VNVAVDGQAFTLVPATNGSFATAQVGGDLFPGIQAVLLPGPMGGSDRQGGIHTIWYLLYSRLKYPVEIQVGHYGHAFDI
jgi:hypothetical protein